MIMDSGPAVMNTGQPMSDNDMINQGMILNNPN